MTPLSARILPDLTGVAGPAYDRKRLIPRVAHIGVGAFHRCHQAEYTDDLAALGGDAGIVGINIRAPSLERLSQQGGLYTRLIRQGDRVMARVIGSIVRTVDSQHDAAPALAVLTDKATEIVTMTVTEKAYCHNPATGQLNLTHPDIAHDLTHPETPRSLPGLLVRALDQRQGKPLTLISCDNIPANGALLKGVVLTLAARQNDTLARWIDQTCAFPGTMVDRIAPAPSGADTAFVTDNFGYDDAAVVTCEPFKQWVIEDHFAGPIPAWNMVGAEYVADAAPYEILKMRVLNGAQTTLAHLGALCGLEHTFDDMADPVLSAFVEKMLMTETLATLRPIQGLSAKTYVAQSLTRLRNTAIRHRNHQIATDASQKIVQRILNPLTERLKRSQTSPLLTAAVAGWMVYLIRAASRFGAKWPADDPCAARITALADRIGHDSAALTQAILGLDDIFAPDFAANSGFVTGLASSVDALLTGDPRDYLRKLLGIDASDQLNATQTAGYS